jgi:hypothetical protein
MRFRSKGLSPTSWKLAWLVKRRPDPSESINRANRIILGYIIVKVGREQNCSGSDRSPLRRLTPRRLCSPVQLQNHSISAAAANMPVCACAW